MSKPRKDEPVKTPYYRGGNEALFQFIQKHLKYPKEALEAKIKGTVEVAYDVDGNGKVKHIRVLEGLGYGCDEEVIRLVGLLKYEKAYNKGRNVTLHRKLKVNFKLPTVNKSAKQSSKPSTGKIINYQLVKAQPKQEETKKQTTKSISYTINYRKN